MLKCTRCKVEKPETAAFFPLHNKTTDVLEYARIYLLSFIDDPEADHYLTGVETGA